MANPRILIVDDDTRLRRLLRRYLQGNGFAITEMASADEALQILSVLTFDLVIADVMMPGMNGFEMVQKIRANGNQIPILMLTAMGEVDDRITGLESGADDYLGKPFDPKELLLRINSILRRVSSVAEKQENIIFGNCAFNIKTGVLRRAGDVVPLTGAETELLRFLAEKAGQLVSREELKTLIKSDNERTVDVQMTRLRKKLEIDGTHPVYLQTIRGQGYRLATG